MTSSVTCLETGLSRSGSESTWLTQQSSAWVSSEGCPKALVAKTALDGHWRGVMAVANALRQDGFEVVMLGMATAEQIATSAIQEDVDLVGLNIGGRIEVVERILDALEEAQIEAPVVAGGTIPPQWRQRLENRGVEVFPPGSPLGEITAAARRLVAHRASK